MPLRNLVNQTQLATPPQANNATLYRSRNHSDTDNAKVISDITAWYNTLPRDDGQVTIKNGVGGNISYSKAGKLFVYFDGLRKTVELDGAGELHRCTGGTISLHDGEREYSVLDYEYGYYDSTARDKVHITLVRQDDNGIYAAHNEMSDTSRHDVFSSTDF